MATKDFSLKRIKRDLIEALTSCQAEQEGDVEIWVPPSDDSFKCWIIKINVPNDEGSLFMHTLKIVNSTIE